MRKRFFLIARCDGKAIIWPEPTHGPADSLEVAAGLREPYIGAYTQIDFSLPCPSIFDTAEEIKLKYGIKAVRPLAPKTMERIARGLKKFVLDNPEPFIIQCNHGGNRKPQDIREPMPTITGKHGFGVVEPVLSPCIMCNNENNVGASVESPLPTITTGNRNFVVAPTLIQYHSETSKDGVRGQGIEDPIMTVDSRDRYGLVAPTLIQYHSETSKDEVRGQGIEEPIMTVDASNRYGLVTSFLQKYYDGGYKGAGVDLRDPLPTVTAVDHNSICAATLIQMNNHCDGRNIKEPLPTITAGDGHFGEVRAFLIKYYGCGTGQDIKEPLDTVTSQDRFSLVTIQGVDYQIVDIGLRMLEPKELYGCQGFPDDYIIDRDYTWRTYPRSEQVKRCGNAVCPPIPAALVRANLPELCMAERKPNPRISEERTGQLRFA